MKKMINITFIIACISILVIIFLLTYLQKSHRSRQEMERLIEMVAADGVFTPNEKILITKLSNEMGFNYKTIIESVKERIENLNNKPETELIDYNKKNGKDFENFIVPKFNEKYFKIKEWRGDKYANGRYSKTNLYPDILLEFELNEKKAEFAIECKWRSKYYKGGIEFGSKEQLKRYQEFGNSRHLPVFIVLGIGGTGEDPNRLFIIPIEDIESNFISINKLEAFERKIENKFYFDISKKELK